MQNKSKKESIKERIQKEKGMKDKVAYRTEEREVRGSNPSKGIINVILRGGLTNMRKIIIERCIKKTPKCRLKKKNVRKIFVRNAAKISKTSPTKHIIGKCNCF